MNSHIKNSLIDKVIMDRCALDGLVYTDWMSRKGKVQQWVIEYADNVFKMLIGRYDYYSHQIYYEQFPTLSILDIHIL